MSDAKMFWEVQKELCKDNLIGIQAIGDDEFLIALVFEPDNAKLIAAAPEMFEAIQDLFEQRKYIKGFDFTKLENAFEKATGEQK
tara:strand:+ start:3791 stop:4045 length:255 start_codon:yes stop_codon:yes gene_type:complete